MHRADSCCGLLYGCGGRQLAAQIVFLLAIIAYVSVTILIFCVCLQYLGILRISKRAERMGIDAYDHGGEEVAEATVALRALVMQSLGKSNVSVANSQSNAIIN
jgi:ammonium transporter, Amt family